MPANFTGTFRRRCGIPRADRSAGRPVPAAGRPQSDGSRCRAGPYRRILATFDEWRRDRNVPKLLLAYYLVNDGSHRDVLHGTDVSQILRDGSAGNPGPDAVLQVVAIPATIFFGWLGGRWSQRGATNFALSFGLPCSSVTASADGRAGAIRGHGCTGAGHWFDAEPVPQHVRRPGPDRSRIRILRLSYADGPDLGRVRSAGVRSGECSRPAVNAWRWRRSRCSSLPEEPSDFDAHSQR